MVLRLAEINIGININPDYIEDSWLPYITDEPADVHIELTDTDFAVMRKEVPKRGQKDIELAAAQRAIYETLALYDAFVLHAVSIDVDGECFLFSAAHGTGKTTHIKLWKEKFGDRMKIVNGDRTILRRIDGEVYAYGSPWCGKEKWQNNIKSRVKGICFLERGEQNVITRMDAGKEQSIIFKNILVAKQKDKLLRQMELLTWLMKNVPFYALSCNMEPEAADVAYAGMKS